VIWYSTNRTSIQMLSIFVNANRDDWDDHLPYLLMAYRATIYDSTGYSPHKIMLAPVILFPGFHSKQHTELCDLVQQQTRPTLSNNHK
jgi:hypothetical protein